jgi:hypothetical protein
LASKQILCWGNLQIAKQYVMICFSRKMREKYYLMALNNFYGPRQLNRYGDLLRAGRSVDRVPVEARFSAPVQTGPGAHPASCTTGNGYFLGVNGRGVGLTTKPPFSTEVKERVEPYLYSPSGS